MDGFSTELIDGLQVAPELLRNLDRIEATVSKFHKNLQLMVSASSQSPYADPRKIQEEANDLSRLQESTKPLLSTLVQSLPFEDRVFEEIRAGIRRSLNMRDVFDFLNKHHQQYLNAETENRREKRRIHDDSEPEVDEELYGLLSLSFGLVPAARAREAEIVKRATDEQDRLWRTHFDTAHVHVSYVRRIVEYFAKAVRLELVHPGSEQDQTAATASDQQQRQQQDRETAFKQWQAEGNAFTILNSVLRSKGPMLANLNSPMDADISNFDSLYRLCVPFPKTLLVSGSHRMTFARTSARMTLLNVIKKCCVPSYQQDSMEVCEQFVVSVDALLDRLIAVPKLSPASSCVSPSLEPEQFCKIANQFAVSLNSHWDVVVRGSWDRKSMSMCRYHFVRHFLSKFPSQTCFPLLDRSDLLASLESPDILDRQLGYVYEHMPPQRPLVFERNGIYALIFGVRWMPQEPARRIDGASESYKLYYSFPFTNKEGYFTMCTSISLASRISEFVEHTRNRIRSQRFYFRRLFMFLAGFIVIGQPEVYRNFVTDQIASLLQCAEDSNLSQLFPSLSKLSHMNMRNPILKIARLLSPTTNQVLSEFARLFETLIPVLSAQLDELYLKGSLSSTEAPKTHANSSLEEELPGSSSGMSSLPEMSDPVLQRLSSMGSVPTKCNGFLRRVVSASDRTNVLTVPPVFDGSGDSDHFVAFRDAQIHTDAPQQNGIPVAPKPNLHSHPVDSLCEAVISELSHEPILKLEPISQPVAQLNSTGDPRSLRTSAFCLLVQCRVMMRSLLRKDSGWDAAKCRKLMQVTTTLSTAQDVPLALIADAKLLIALSAELSPLLASPDCSTALHCIRRCLDSMSGDYSGRKSEHLRSMTAKAANQYTAVREQADAAKQACDIEKYSKGRMQVLAFVPVSSTSSPAKLSLFASSNDPKRDYGSCIHPQLNAKSECYGWVDVESLFSMDWHLPIVPEGASEWEDILGVGNVSSENDVLLYSRETGLAQSWENAQSLSSDPYANSCWRWTLLAPHSTPCFPSPMTNRP
eukprot:ANDGO_04283.mRNA.1 hypothetical protein